MKLPGLLFKLGTVDVSGIENEVNNLTQEQWIEWDLRQNRYKVHSATESYPLMFSEYGEEPKTYNVGTPLWNVSQHLMGKLESFYNRKVGAAVYVKLKPHTNIIPHTDGGWFVDTHRIHVPIITDRKILFSLDGKKFHLERGSIYELNNLVEHGVENPTDVGRVHLMIDILPDRPANPAILKSPLESIGYESLKINELLTA
jgi:aspartyl/asparaginyl beta-hydroxylase (cupin superfamily)